MKRIPILHAPALKTWLHLSRALLRAGALSSLSVGCVGYSAIPLSQHSDLPTEVPRLTITASSMPFPHMAAHVFDPSDGLDIVEVAMLAVVNNPELKLARDEARVVAAQAFAAGLLSDPQLTATQDTPVNGGPGTTTANSLGLNYDIRPLFTRASAKAAAQAQQRSVDLNILWQEWLVVSQARVLFVRDLDQRKLLAVLQEIQALFQRRYELARQQLQSGNATLDAVSAYSIELQQANRQVNEVRRQMNQNHHDLAELLGLAPSVHPELVGDPGITPLDPQGVRQDLPLLPKRRPDMLALEEGYRSQEFRVRKAILDQFPAINIGINQASDIFGLATHGFGISLSLPVFDRNRGNIAIEKATRQRLYDEYQIRLNAASTRIEWLLNDQALLQGQLASVNAELATLRDAVRSAEGPYAAGNMNVHDYTGLQASLLAKQAEAIGLEQAILEQRIALLTLTGGDLPE